MRIPLATAADVAALATAKMSGEVRDSAGAVIPTKRVVVTLDAFGNINDITVEEIL